MADRMVEEIYSEAVSGDARSVRLTGFDIEGDPFSLVLDLLHLVDIVRGIPDEWVVSDIPNLSISWHPEKDVLQIMREG